MSNKIHTLASVLVSRAAIASRLGQQYGGDRDLYQALGYPLTLTYSDMLARYTRQDIAKAIIDKPVTVTWRGGFKIVESTQKENTTFETAWDDLCTRLQLVPKFARVDRLVGLGSYGILFLGFNDATTREDFAKPVIAGKRKLMYVKPFGQDSAPISKWEEDPTSERYGLPLLYEVHVTNPGSNTTSILSVHYSRVIHITDNLLESEAEGSSRLEVVFNRLMDIEKLVGGSAEMYWRGARPGYQGKVSENYTMSADAKEALQTQLDEFEHNLRRFLINEGVDVQALTQQLADPTAHLDAQIQMISAVTGIPKRILTGSERGELASSQDAESWFGIITERRKAYAEPNILRPFIEKMVETGVLPSYGKDGYAVEWESLFDVSEQEKTTVGKTRAEALASYVGNPESALYVPPEAFFKLFLGLDESDVEYITELQDQALIEEAKYAKEHPEDTEEDEDKEEDDEEDDEDKDKLAAHGGPGSGNKGHAGRPGKRGGSASTEGSASSASAGSSSSNSKLMGAASDFGPCILSLGANKKYQMPSACKDIVARDGKYIVEGAEVSASEKKRIAALKIPKEWTDVVVAKDPKAAVLAIGKYNNKWKYIYSAKAQGKRNVDVFQRTKAFSKDIEKLRARVEVDAAKGNASAHLFRLIDKTAIRAGGEKQQGKVKTYGATTLQHEHAQVTGDKITLDFVAKTGKLQHYELTDPTLAKFIAERKARTKPGEQLFPDAPATAVNKYIGAISKNKSVGGKQYTIKDLRSYHGTRIAYQELAAYAGKELTAVEKKRVVKAVTTTVSDFLRNTPAVAKESYIDPMVWELIGEKKGISTHEDPDDDLTDYGGPGSGHWGHAGKPGQLGGSVAKDTAVSIRTGKDAEERQKAAGAKGKAAATDSVLKELSNTALLYTDSWEDGDASRAAVKEVMKNLATAEYDAATQQLKSHVSSYLTEKVGSDPDVQAYLRDPHIGFDPSPEVKAQWELSTGNKWPSRETEGFMQDFVHQWAETSGDTSRHSLFVQAMAQKEFGLTSAATKHLELDNIAWTPDNKPLSEAAQAGCRKLLRAMYDETQRALKEQGITEVTAYRGTGISVTGSNAVPAQLTTVTDPSAPYPVSATVAVKTQPISSFSTSLHVAEDFALERNSPGNPTVIVGARVPANRILCMPGTGFGCYDEEEIVILGGTDTASARLHRM